MTVEERNRIVDDCVMMEAGINGVSEEAVNRDIFDLMEDEDLIKEHDWLSDMFYLK